MKKIITAALTALLLLGLTACGGKPAEPAQAETPAIEPTSKAESAEGAAERDTLVVYFSRVGNTDFPDDVDAVSSASLSRDDSALKGNAQRMAEWMADEAGAELFEIQTETAYPSDYRETIEVAKQEQTADDRPALKTHIDGFDVYSTVYLAFPNWWGDLPMALCSFFDEYDFSGKTLYVSVTHEGSGFSHTIDTVRSMEPDADVVEGLSIRGASVPDSEETVRQFVRDHL